MLRVEPKKGPPRYDLRKPKILQEAEKILQSGNEQDLAALKELFAESLLSSNNQVQDEFFNLFAKYNATSVFRKEITADIQQVYAGDEVHKGKFRNVVEVNPDAIYAHLTAMATVDLEDNGYHIKPHSSKYINSNGDAWERALVIRTVGTFFDAYNYKEHLQIPSFSKGRVVDYMLKDVGDAIYIDLLVEVTDPQMIQSIILGEYSKCSIGCSYAFVVCSKCGEKFSPTDPRCSHLLMQLKQTFIDENGIERIIAEVLTDLFGETVFYELSWVRNPAFAPAVLHSILRPSGKLSAKRISMSDLLTMGNIVNTSLILPVIRKATGREKVFYMTAAYFILKTPFSFIKKAVLMKLLSKFPVPTVAGLGTYFYKLGNLARLSGKEKKELKRISFQMRSR